MNFWKNFRHSRFRRDRSLPTMSGAIPSPCIPFAIAIALALLVTRPSAASPTPPLATAPGSAVIFPVNQVVSLSNPGVAMVRPTDGRLRGYGFSAEVTGVAAVDSAGPAPARSSPGPIAISWCSPST